MVTVKYDCSIFKCEPRLAIQPYLILFVWDKKMSIVKRIHLKMEEISLVFLFLKNIDRGASVM